MDILPNEYDQVVDWATFSRTRSELGAGFVRILGYFKEDGDKAVAKIEEAMQRSDAAALVMPAHTMKSEARQFGAEPLGALTETIEMAARRSVEMRLPPDELIPQVAKLRPLYNNTLEQLEQAANPLRQRRSGFGQAG